MKPGVVLYTPNSQNLNGYIYCKAITNYGIESDKKRFNLKVYSALDVNPGGPYTGKPKKPVTLKGWVNTNGYPGATFQYEWTLQKTNTKGKLVEVNSGKKTDATLKTTWNKDGNYKVTLTVQVTTSEGLTLTGSAETMVKLEAGIPTALPGGPYRGGITGGSFSPIQFEGNRPDFVEDPDVGKIVAWKWSFSSPPKERVLQFDGKDDYIELPSFKTGGDMTVIAWVYSQNPNAPSNRIIDFGNGSSADNILFAFEGTTGKIRWEVYQGSASQGVSTSEVFPKNQWVHVAAVQQGNAAKIYWNGVENASGAVHSPNQISRDKQYIGKSNRPDAFFYGKMDEVSVWNRPLTQAEIQANMNKPLTGNEKELIGYWNFNEGTGVTAFDFSPSGNDGTLKDGAQWVGPGDTGVATVWNPTRAYPKPGQYTVRLLVKGETGKWSPPKATTVQVIDGKIAGYVKAADLRTPVKGVWLTLTSSHVDKSILTKTAKKLETALQFDGKDDFVEVSSGPTITGTGPHITYMAWIKPNPQNERTALYGAKESVQGIQLQVNSNGTKVGGYMNIGDWHNVVDGTITPNEWNHVAVAYDGNSVRTYVNGVKTHEQSESGKTFVGLDRLWIGAYQGNSQFYAGLADEVAILNRALTQSEIQAIM